MTAHRERASSAVSTMTRELFMPALHTALCIMLAAYGTCTQERDPCPTYDLALCDDSLSCCWEAVKDKASPSNKPDTGIRVDNSLGGGGLQDKDQSTSDEGGKNDKDSADSFTNDKNKLPSSSTSDTSVSCQVRPVKCDDGDLSSISSSKEDSESPCLADSCHQCESLVQCQPKETKDCFLRLQISESSDGKSCLEVNQIENRNFLPNLNSVHAKCQLVSLDSVSNLIRIKIKCTGTDRNCECLLDFRHRRSLACQSCSSTPVTPEASPPTTPVTPEASPTTTTATHQPGKTTSATWELTGTEAAPAPTPVSSRAEPAHQAGRSAGPLTPSSGNTAQSDPQRQDSSPSPHSAVVVPAAVVAAVLLLVSAGLGLLAWVRRRRGGQVCGACFKDGPGKGRGRGVTATSNVTYSLDSGDAGGGQSGAAPGDVPLQSDLTAQSDSGNNGAVEACFAEGPENEYSVIQLADDEETTMPVLQAKSPGYSFAKIQPKLTSSAYSLAKIQPDLTKSTAVSLPANDYNTLNFHSGSHNLNPEPVPPSDDQGEYNRLTLPERAAQPETETAAPVYHCLEEQPGDMFPNPSPTALDQDCMDPLPEETSAVYHILDEAPTSQTLQKTARDHNLKRHPPLHQHQQQQQQQQQQQHAEAGIYHVLEPDSGKNRISPTSCIYEVPPHSEGIKRSAGASQKKEREETLHLESPSHPEEAAAAADGDGDYSSLDLQGVRGRAQKRDKQDPEPVYNHVNEHRADIYHELTRAQRRETIDNVYSHVV